MNSTTPEPNFFSEYERQIGPTKTDYIDNPRDRELLTMLRDERESNLSPYAFKSKCSQGRLAGEEDCLIRSPYERDTGRIIYSQAFRRLRHKTQVFFNPKNDHICSRIEHVIYVNYIATTIARALNLNIDLVQAISLGHDIGHSPFGHSGERALNQCAKKYDSSLFFHHEMQSLRVADYLAGRNKGYKNGLNLTFEVRDGIVSHCGETYSEYKLTPNRDKKIEQLMSYTQPADTTPATLEGCVVRIADKIAYVGRDIEDAARAGILEFEDIPPAIRSRLGQNNSQIINTLVADIVHHSLNKDEIMMSEDAGEAMQELLKENVNRIYRSEKIKRYEQSVTNTVEALFDALMASIVDPDKAEKSDNNVYKELIDFARVFKDEGQSDARIVMDYIAGMTDSFATRCYEKIYWV